MAEPTSSRAAYSASAPVLHSTADEVPYVPVSWLAVAAASVAGLYALLLGIMGLIAFRARRPLLEEELLIFAVVAIVLSFAARRVVRNSEGTRTGTLFGIDLPAAAWWAALVLGLGYGSYLLAIEFSIRKDASNEVKAWSDLMLKGDPESLTRAFHRTQDPSQRKGIRPDDAAQLEGRWGSQYTAFRQCDLVRLVARNPGCKFEVGGLRTWQFKTNVECTFTATLTCPEGIFSILVPLRGIEGSAAGTDGGGRQWQVDFSPAGYIDKERALLTPYGWRVALLTVTGGETARRFIAAGANSRELRTAAYLDFVSSSADDMKFLQPLTFNAAQARAAAFGIPAGYGFTPGPEFLDYTADKLFVLPGGLKPDADRSKTFRHAWNTTGIVRAGERLRDSTDVNDQIAVTDAAIEYRIPIEIPLPSTKGEMIAARGKVLMVCTDPTILAEAKRLRDSAQPSDATRTPGSDSSLISIPWRVLWIESDLKPIRMEMRPQGPPGSDGPPGM